MAGPRPVKGVLRGDVAVIGAGPAGLALALRAADAGAEVVVLEAGAATPTDLHLGRVTSDGGPGLHPADHLDLARKAAIGGTAHSWCVEPRPGGGNYVRIATPHTHHLAARPDLGVAGWPIEYPRFEPYLHDGARFLGLPSADDELTTPRGPDLGADWIPRWHQLAPASAVTDEALQAAQAHARITLVERTHVDRLQVTDERVDGAVGHGEAGEVRVDAPDVVIATGTMATLKLLLRERDAGRVPDPGGRLGHGVMDHPHLGLGHVAADPALLPDVAELHDAHDVDGRWAMGHHALAPDAAERTGLPDAALQLSGATAAAMPRHGFGLRPGLRREERIAVLRSHVAGRRARRLPLYRPRLGGWSDEVASGDIAVYVVHTMLADTPDPAKRVELRPRDSGVPELIWHWAWQPSELDRVRQLTALAGTAMERAGLGTFVPWPELRRGATDAPRAASGWHHMGGAPASVDPATGVVDPQLQHHVVSGLHVASLAVAPNSIGAANPTLALVALAMRLADQLDQ